MGDVKKYVPQTPIIHSGKNDIGREYIQKSVLFGDEKEKQTLLREFEALKIMRTGNFLPIFNYHIDDQQILVQYEKYYCSLDVCLTKLSNSRQYLNERGIFAFFLPILKAAYSLHLKGFIHRNINRYNVLIGNSGDVMLGGLELIRKYQGKDSKATNIPLLHLPNEVITGDYDEKVDVYSLGLLLYELCTLEPITPALKRTLKDIKKIILPPHLNSSQFPNLIMSMINNDQGQRMSSIEVITDELINLAIIKYRGDIPYFHNEIDPKYLSSNDSSVLRPININAPSRVIKELGSGGCGRVLLVSIDDSEFAFKEVSGDTVLDPYDEIKYSKQLIHDNIIIPFFPLCSKDPNVRPFRIFLEKCENNLTSYAQDLFYSVNNFSVIGIFKVLCSVINALYWIHKNDLAHRDIKSDNILITKNGMVVLSDLGGIKKQSQNGTFKTYIASKGYEAPELSGLNYTGSVDIYSLGCLIYFLCTFEYPPSERDLTGAALNGTTFGFKLPPIYDEISDLQLLITKMTKYDPKKRITIDDLIAHPTIINYNFITRSIPFLINGKLNPQMCTSRILPKRRTPTTQFSLSHYLENGASKLPNSGCTYLQFPEKLSGSFISDLCYLFPTVEELIQDENSNNVNFSDGCNLDRILVLIEKYLFLLGFRSTVKNGRYKLEENPKLLTQWGTEADVYYANNNIISLLRYFVGNNPNNKELTEKLTEIYTVFIKAGCKYRESFQYIEFFEPQYLLSATSNGTVDNDKFMKLNTRIKTVVISSCSTQYINQSGES